MNIEDELHQTLLDNYKKAGQETGYWGNYFLREVRTKGGLATAKNMLKSRRSVKVAPGLQKLIDAGRIDLSVEATATNPRFCTLFTEPELDEARRRLENLPAYTRHRATAPELNFPDEIENDPEFSEGARRQVTINAYERNPAARSACIRKHGLGCSVCGMNFKERYGPIGQGFIHVHHKKPLAIRRSQYRLHATTDMAPVCPNCHAMLHTQDPPLGIDELRTIYEQHNAT